MNPEERLESMTAADLAPVVRRAVGAVSAWPLRWHVESLGWAAVNPATQGLYRLTGVARVGSADDVGWAVVLKVLGDVDLAGTPLDVGWLHDPQDINYWKREAVAFESGLLDDWPGPLVAVRCLGVDHTDPGVWLWLEDLGGAQAGDQWSLEEQAVLAYDLGAFAAQWAGHAPSASRYPWLLQRWLRGNLTCFRDVGIKHALDHDGCWRHPLVAAALQADARQRVKDLFDGAEGVLAVLESLPVTLAHHDTQPSNFFLRRPADGDNRRTVAIDWGFLGLAPVGHDLGCHLWANLRTWTIDPRDAADLDRGSTSAYLQGLADFGWDGDEQAVLFARAAAGAITTATHYLGDVSSLCDQMPNYVGNGRWPHELAQQHQLSVEALMTRWAAGLDYALDLGEEAQGLSRALR